MAREYSSEHAFPISVAASFLGGRGVFAKRPIKPDEIIEACPILLFNENATVLNNYLFTWEKINDENTYALPLGYGALYNHSLTPNAYWITDEDNLEIVFY